MLRGPTPCRRHPSSGLPGPRHGRGRPGPACISVEFLPQGGFGAHPVFSFAADPLFSFFSSKPPRSVPASCVEFCLPHSMHPSDQSISRMSANLPVSQPPIFFPVTNEFFTGYDRSPDRDQVMDYLGDGPEKLSDVTRGETIRIEVCWIPKNLRFPWFRRTNGLF